MKIAVIGTGYVGLVTGACFADVGVEVVCIDKDEQKIANLRKGILPIYEPGLDDIVARNYASGRLQFSTTLAEAIQNAEVIFIAVGTPAGEDGSADLRYVKEVANQIGQALNHYAVVVTKSTVPVGTNVAVKNSIQAALENRKVDIEFSVASNPEFLKEGAAVQDFLRPDRVVIGVEDEKAKEIMTRLYKPFQLVSERMVYMDILSAEVTKYAANALLATKISFMNDMANLCEKVGANINMVRKGIGTDARIGNKFIYAGVGYGGSCFPKDVKAIVHTAKEFGHELKVLQAVEEVNENQKKVLAQKVKKHFGDDLSGKTFAIWGLSFKPNTNDMREAPSLTIINDLLRAGATVQVYDPIAIEEAKEFYLKDTVTYSRNAYEVCKNAHALILVTEWPEFRLPKWKEVAELLNEKVIFDGRNIYDAEHLKSLGFTYYGIGL